MVTATQTAMEIGLMVGLGGAGLSVLPWSRVQCNDVARGAIDVARWVSRRWRTRLAIRVPATA